MPGRIGATVEFIDSMDNLDEAIKSMTAMLNKYNRASVYIGVDKDGDAISDDLTDDDVQKVIDTINTKVNNCPELKVSLNLSDNGKRYILIDAIGYETPYSFGTWFYIRKCIYTKPDPDGPVIERWTQTLTCSMKRHRSNTKDSLLSGVAPAGFSGLLITDVGSLDSVLL